MDGKEAILQFQKSNKIKKNNRKQISLILLDLELPIING